MKYVLHAIILCALLASSPALAHHQLGLPHYMYSQDYPQIPTMVIEADAEGHVVTFSIFPGNPRPGDTVRLKVYIKRKSSGKAFTKPIKLSVSRVTLFGGEAQILAPRLVASEYNEYRQSFRFKKAEKYLVNVTFEPRPDFHEKIPFPLVIGKTNFSVIPIAFGIVLLIIFIAVGLQRRKQQGSR